MKKVVVIGATGMLGKPVTRVLMESGFDLTLAVRDEKKARRLFPAAKIVQADVFDLAALKRVFKGNEIVYVNLHTPPESKPSDHLTEKEGIDNIIAAATETGIRRIALLSSMVMRYNGMDGYRWWLLSVKQLAVDKLIKSGIPYTIFYASSFMETFDQIMLKGNNIMLAGKSKFPNWMIAGGDFGRQVARSFENPDDQNHEYMIQGPEAYTWDQAAKIFRDHYNVKKLRVLKVPLPLLEILGNFSRAAKYVQKISIALNNYTEKFESEQTWLALGKPTTTLAAYAAALTKRSGS